MIESIISVLLPSLGGFLIGRVYERHQETKRHKAFGRGMEEMRLELEQKRRERLASERRAQP